MLPSFSISLRLRRRDFRRLTRDLAKVPQGVLGPHHCARMTEDEFWRHPWRPAGVTWAMVADDVRRERSYQRRRRAGWRHAWPLALGFAAALAAIVAWSVR